MISSALANNGSEEIVSRISCNLSMKNIVLEPGGRYIFPTILNSFLPVLIFRKRDSKISSYG